MRTATQAEALKIMGEILYPKEREHGRNVVSLGGEGTRDDDDEGYDFHDVIARALYMHHLGGGVIVPRKPRWVQDRNKTPVPKECLLTTINRVEG